jgi:hypothetical protein
VSSGSHCHRAAPLLGVALLCLACHAGEAPRASLTCFIDGAGTASAYLFIGSLDPKPKVLVEALGQALGTGVRDALIDVSEEKKVITCAARSRGRFWAHQYQVRGQIDLSPLTPVFQQAGAREIEVHLTHPRATFCHCGPLSAMTPTTGALWLDYFDQVPFGTRVQFDFGYLRNDVMWAVVPPFALALLLIGWAWISTRSIASRSGVTAN